MAAPSLLLAPRGMQVTRPHTRLERLGGELLASAARLAPVAQVADGAKRWFGRGSHAALRLGALFALVAVVLGAGVLLASGRDRVPADPGGLTPPAPAFQSTPTRRELQSIPVNDAEEAPPSGQRQPLSQSHLPRAAHVTLTVRVEPARHNATLRWRRQTHRGSLSRLIVPRGDVPVSLQVRAPGYQTETFPVVPDRDRELLIRLRPRPMSARRRPPRSMLIDLE